MLSAVQVLHKDVHHHPIIDATSLQVVQLLSQNLDAITAFENFQVPFTSNLCEGKFPIHTFQSVPMCIAWLLFVNIQIGLFVFVQIENMLFHHIKYDAHISQFIPFHHQYKTWRLSDVGSVQIPIQLFHP